MYGYLRSISKGIGKHYHLVQLPHENILLISCADEYLFGEKMDLINDTEMTNETISLHCRSKMFIDPSSVAT